MRRNFLDIRHKYKLYEIILQIAADKKHFPLVRSGRRYQHVSKWNNFSLSP